MAVHKHTDPNPVPSVITNSSPRPETAPSPWTSASLTILTGTSSLLFSSCSSGKFLHPLPRLGALLNHAVLEYAGKAG
jgi:hypothetical protein